METNEISLHQAKVFKAASTTWKTAAEIAIDASVAPRTGRHHCKILSDAGIFDQAEVFPAHRYRLSDKAQKRNKAFFERIIRACEIFNV